jgi:hypothetical protein
MEARLSAAAIPTTVFLSPALRRQAEVNAAAARRSLSNYLADILASCIDQDGPGLRREPAEASR